MKNYIIICGLNDKNTRKQEITTERARQALAGIILDYADGATLTECNGIYKHEGGGEWQVVNNNPGYSDAVVEALPAGTRYSTKLLFKYCI